MIFFQTEIGSSIFNSISQRFLLFKCFSGYVTDHWELEKLLMGGNEKCEKTTVSPIRRDAPILIPAFVSSLVHINYHRILCKFCISFNSVIFLEILLFVAILSISAFSACLKRVLLHTYMIIIYGNL